MPDHTRRSFFTATAAAGLAATTVAATNSYAQDDPLHLLDNPLNPLNPIDVDLPNVSKLAEKLFNELKTFVRDKSEQFNNFVPIDTDKLPGALRVGPVELLRAASQFSKVIEETGSINLVRARIAATEKSLTYLLRLVSGSDGVNNSQLLTAPFKVITDVLSGILNGTDPKALIANVIESAIDPKSQIFAPMINGILNSLEGKDRSFFQSWLEMPSGLGPGQLREWLDSGYARQDELVGDVPVFLEERELRFRLAGEVDSYFRQRIATDKTSSRATRSDTPLVSADQRMSTEVIGDMLSLFMKTTVTFILEPISYPQLASDWSSFEDVAHELAVSYGKQLSAGVRTSVGTLLRGVWVWSVQNTNLIELLATLTGSFVGSICEGVMRNIAGTFQLVSGQPGDIPPGVPIVYSSSCSEVFSYLERNQLKKRLVPIAYSVVMRRGDLETAAKIRGLLTRLPNAKMFFDDVIAYTHLAYSRHRNEPILSHDRLGLGKYGNVDAVAASVRPAQITGKGGGFAEYGNVLEISATSSKANEWPMPVLRCYHPFGVTMLLPVEAGKYVGMVDSEKGLREVGGSGIDRKFLSKCVVVSSRGGTSGLDVNDYEVDDNPPGGDSAVFPIGPPRTNDDPFPSLPANVTPCADQEVAVPLYGYIHEYGAFHVWRGGGQAMFMLSGEIPAIGRSVDFYHARLTLVNTNYKVHGHLGHLYSAKVGAPVNDTRYFFLGNQNVAEPDMISNGRRVVIYMDSRGRHLWRTNDARFYMV